MGGYFAAVSKEDCVFDLFFGVDYHSHLGTRRAGMAAAFPILRRSPYWCVPTTAPLP